MGLSVFGVVLETAILLLAKDTVRSFNGLRIWDGKLKSRTKTGNDSPEKLDILGISLNIIAKIVGVYPYFLILFGGIFEVDPFSVLYKHLVAPNLGREFKISLKLVFTFLRLNQIFPTIQTCHVCACFTCIATVGAHLLLSNIAHLVDKVDQNLSKKHGANSETLSETLAIYSVLEICLILSFDVINSCILVLMGFAFVFCVAANFISIKMYDTVPMPLYLYFPSISVLMPGMIKILLPMAIKIYEGAKVLNGKWKVLASFCKEDVKYLRRKLRATKILQVYGGIFGFRFYHCRNSTMSDYAYVIMDYTISALFAV